jgi:hypothetical protein
MKFARFVMRSLLFVLLCCITHVAPGSILRIQSVVLPLYLHGAETDTEISFEAIQFVTAHSDPECRYSAIATPYIPPVVGDSKPGDINMVIEAAYAEDNKVIVVTIDATKAIRPEDYPFTIDEIIDAVTTCVKLATPPRPAEDGGLKINVKRPKAKANGAK